MKKTRQGKGADRYTDEPMEMGEIVADFLPPPHLLVLREEKIKVTLDLNRRTVELFKKYAKKNHIPYQRMIRALVDEYATHLK